MAVDVAAQYPPRNGEGDRPAKPGGGGAESALNQPVRSRVRHRTVGASENNVEIARKLRRDMSLPEVLLWRELRGKPHGLKFRRQFPLLGFVADFACVEIRLLIEIDGAAHTMGERPERDARRDDVLKHEGWDVVRLAAKDVLADVIGAARAIVAHAESLRPLHHDAARHGPPPRSGEDLA